MYTARMAAWFSNIRYNICDQRGHYPSPAAGFLLCRDNCGELQVCVGIIDEAVTVAFWAVMDVSRRKRDDASVIVYAPIAFGDEYYLRTVLVGVHADGCAWNEPSFHNLVETVREHSDVELLLPSLEIGDGILYDS